LSVPHLLPLIVPPVRRLFRRVFPHRPPDFPRLWQECCTKWVVGDTRTDGRSVHATGWLVASSDVRPSVEFRVNGRPADRVVYPVPRPDVADRLPFAPGAAESGFDVWLAGADPGDLTLTVADRRTGRPLGRDYPPYHVPAADRAGPRPGPHQVARVIGAASDFYFRMGGYTAFRRLEEAVREATGEGLADYPRVLDWGCGCGRVSRYFVGVPGCRVTGVDVDPENVGWCRANLPGGAWEVVPLRPPTALPTAGFDLAFGVSVFTHLRESDQHAWLDELRRVIRPGGLALMTFHGDASIVWAGLSAERYTALRRQGIADQPNPLYDAELTEDDYYRDTFHTEGYVRRVWGRHFDILAVRPSEIAHQDLVVMRR
jgi:SAM-dependent methyltransferase